MVRKAISILIFIFYWAESLPENSIAIIPNQAQELILKQFRIYHLLIPKTSLIEDSFYRLIISYHGSVFLTTFRIVLKQDANFATYHQLNLKPWSNY